MSKTVVIYDADDSATNALGPGFAARLGVRGWGLQTFAGFKVLLLELLKGPKIDKLYIVTHGHPGAIKIGGDWLYVGDLTNNFAGRGLENLLNPGAEIYFEGCNIAEVEEKCSSWTPDADPVTSCSVGGHGGYFLLTMAKIFLVKAGGSVAGWTSAGYHNGLVFPSQGDNVLHPLGRQVFVFASRGGKRYRFGVGSKTTIRPKQLWKVWKYGREFFYSFKTDGVYWFTPEQYSKSDLPYYKTPEIPDQYGRFWIDRDGLTIRWFKDHLPVAHETWDVPLFNLHQTGKAFSQDLGEAELTAKMLRDWG